MGNKPSLAICYWNWGFLARDLGDFKTATEKLEQTIAIYTELKMDRDRATVQKALDKVKAKAAGAGPSLAS